MEDESVQPTGVSERTASPNAPLHTPGQDTATDRSRGYETATAARAPLANAQGKQRLSRYRDKARKRRLLRELRKHVVSVGA